MEKKLFIGLIIAFLAIMFSCDNGTTGPIPTVIETISWELDGSGYYQFSTNDEANYGYGYSGTFSSTNQDPFTSYIFYVNRKSGFLGAGYGGVFSNTDTGDQYRILLSGYGNYIVQKRISSVVTTIQDWTASAALLTGTRRTVMSSLPSPPPGPTRCRPLA